MITSLAIRLWSLVAPPLCSACGRRLQSDEEFLCIDCLMDLPRTGCMQDFRSSTMAQRFWGHIDLERAFALVHHTRYTPSAQVVYNLKYRGKRQLGAKMGEFIANLLAETDFFDGIDAIIAVPLARQREHQRGYNQSQQLAHGVSAVTGLPVLTGVVERTLFHRSQTQMDRADRFENVKGVFRVVSPEQLEGRHVLLVDDVITTGATVISLAQEMQRAARVKVSVLSWALGKGR